VYELLASFSLAQEWVGFCSIVGFLLLHHIPSSADGTTETKMYTSEVDAIPAPFRLAFNMFLKLITVPFGCKDLVFVGM
jgi:hypothetical protein